MGNVPKSPNFLPFFDFVGRARAKFSVWSAVTYGVWRVTLERAWKALAMFTGGGAIATCTFAMVNPMMAKAHPTGQVSAEISTATAAKLQVVYPPEAHKTTSDRIFLIGSGGPGVTVTAGDGEAVGIHQSPQGNFAPSFPLTMGENRFILRQGNRTLTRVVTRAPVRVPGDSGWVDDQVLPQGNLGRLPGEQLCFRATGLVSLSLMGLSPLVQFTGGRSSINIPVSIQGAGAPLLDNKAALVDQTDPNGDNPLLGFYGGCGTLPTVAGNYGPGVLQGGRGSVALGTLEILDPDRLPMVEVTAMGGVARTGPSTNHSRLTPLPQGTRATVTGYDGEWLRLSYGAWIRQRETTAVSNGEPLPARLRSVTSRPPRNGAHLSTLDNATEIRFPLDRTVPVSLDQGDRHVTLTLHNTIAETDIVAVSRDAAVERVTWQQTEPTTLQFRVDLRGRPWGYKVRYHNNTLVLRLKHPPILGQNSAQPLQGTVILIDPGHGGDERGAIGPTGYPEKDANLLVSLALRDALQAKGARVVMTRDTDKFVSLGDRQTLIAETEPTLALSIHFNALPDSGNAENTAGIGMFWYHPQAQHLSEHLQDALTRRLNRPTYGVFWNNLALTRPSAAPAVLLELGFMIHPEEFEWIRDAQTPSAIATVLTDAITTWLKPSHDEYRPR
ncbi:MAG: N-acetylmuramoyl-L-alanine amidase [Cyanobacteria bacterium P01_C01_bin.89]